MIFFSIGLFYLKASENKILKRGDFSDNIRAEPD